MVGTFSGVSFSTLQNTAKGCACHYHTVISSGQKYTLLHSAVSASAEDATAKIDNFTFAPARPTVAP